MWLDKWEPLKLSYYSAKSSGYRQCGSGDIWRHFWKLRDVKTASVTVYVHLLSPLFFSLKQMACHILTHEISHWLNIFKQSFCSVSKQITILD